MNMTRLFLTALAPVILVVGPLGAQATCADSIQIKLNSFNIPTGKNDWGSTTDFLNLVKNVNGVKLLNTGENAASGCMYESNDSPKTVFADFGQGRMVVYPADMYTVKMDATKSSFEPTITRMYFDFTIEAAPDLQVAKARIGIRDIIESCSDAADTCRSQAGMQDWWDVTGYAISLQYGPRTVVLKK